MNNNMIQNNFVKMNGILGKMEFSHEVRGEKFYRVELYAKRLSGVADIIPLMISEYLIDANNYCEGLKAAITGQFRSYNRHDEVGNHLLLSVFVREFEYVNEECEMEDENQILLEGYICKAPTYRKTPLGRELADILLAVNRSYNKSDYIPCITWGRSAIFASNLILGTKISIEGRIQSRQYNKNLSETESETKTAYEVSIKKIEVIR